MMRGTCHQKYFPSRLNYNFSKSWLDFSSTAVQFWNLIFMHLLAEIYVEIESWFFLVILSKILNYSWKYCFFHILSENTVVQQENDCCHTYFSPNCSHPHMSTSVRVADLWFWTLAIGSVAYFYVRSNSSKYFEMEILVKIQKYLVLLGINPSDSNRFNWKIAINFLLLLLNLLSVVVFLFSVENDHLMDFVNGFCMFCGSSELCICSLTVVLQKTKVFQIIGSIEELINESELSSFD